MFSFVLITFHLYLLRFALLTLYYFSELTCMIILVIQNQLLKNLQTGKIWVNLAFIFCVLLSISFFQSFVLRFPTITVQLFSYPSFSLYVSLCLSFSLTHSLYFYLMHFSLTYSRSSLPFSRHLSFHLVYCSIRQENWKWKLNPFFSNSVSERKFELKDSTFEIIDDLQPTYRWLTLRESHILQKHFETITLLAPGIYQLGHQEYLWEKIPELWFEPLERLIDLIKKHCA